MVKNIILGLVGVQLMFGTFVLPAFTSGVLGTHTVYAASSDSGKRLSSSVRRKVNKLPKKAVKEIPIPVAFGVFLYDLSDTWGDARSGGRKHEGIDIMAPRGAFIASPTKAVVTRVGKGDLGGNYVYTANPGGETFYFAHLDRVASGIKAGVELEPGDLIGYVGNTGNASSTPPHLHFGIYKRKAYNPFPRIEKEFSAGERVLTLEQALEDMTKEFAKKKKKKSLSIND